MQKNWPGKIGFFKQELIRNGSGPQQDRGIFSCNARAVVATRNGGFLSDW
jgi:hypothetical protein